MSRSASGVPSLHLVAGVDVLGVLTEDHHVDQLGVHDGRGHAGEPPDRAQAHVEVEDLAQGHVQAADAAADGRGQGALDPDEVVTERLDRLVGQPAARLVERLLPRQDLLPGDGAAVLGGRRIEDQLGGGPDVDAGAVALDERDDGLVGDDQDPVVAHADEICHARDATGRGGGPPNSGGSDAVWRMVASEIPTPARPSGPGRDGRRRFTPDAAALPVWRRGGAETMMESPCSAPRGGSEDVHRRAELDTLDTDGAARHRQGGGRRAPDTAGARRARRLATAARPGAHQVPGLGRRRAAAGPHDPPPRPRAVRLRGGVHPRGRERAGTRARGRRPHRALARCPEQPGLGVDAPACARSCSRGSTTSSTSTCPTQPCSAGWWSSPCLGGDALRSSPPSTPCGTGSHSSGRC